MPQTMKTTIPRAAGPLIFRTLPDGSKEYLLNHKDGGHPRWANLYLLFGGGVEPEDIVNDESGGEDSVNTCLNTVIREMTEELLMKGEPIRLSRGQLSVLVDPMTKEPLLFLSPRKDSEGIYMMVFVLDATDLLKPENDQYLTTTEGSMEWVRVSRAEELYKKGELHQSLAYEPLQAFWSQASGVVE